MEQLLNRTEVERLTMLSRSSIYELMRNDDFPAPVRVGRKAVRWIESELTDWLERRERSYGDINKPAVGAAGESENPYLPSNEVTHVQCTPGGVSRQGR